ncbi:TIGR01777 family oxidoreductase [Litoribaculum gwangyangense]|uniref:TIGR01777 family oxidoreductase n=1 Tax=Litoribaculum gwangyangense TaxID=1130722 RepID=A0ABP9CQP9_9FLAO
MRVLITGATGLIGGKIVKICHQNGIKINYLTTSKSKINDDENYQGFFWNPKSGEIDKECFKNVTAIIHLAGASVSKRWTSSYKKEILNSRLETTQLLVKTLSEINHSVTQVVSASAIGIYQDSLTNYYDEDYKVKDETSFLTHVVKEWEQAVDAFSSLNIMVSKVRIGLVLSKNGGALKEMVKPIKFGVGAAFGTGQQWQSWIHINDLARQFVYILKHDLEGVFNGVAPNPVSNQELTKAIANILNKPLFLPNIPKFFMKLVLGEMHTILFESQRVSSKKIEDNGFEFKYHHLQPALENLLK